MSVWLPQSALLGRAQVAALGTSRTAWLWPALGCCGMAWPWHTRIKPGAAPGSAVVALASVLGWV